MVNTLYTPEVRNFVHTRNWPRGLVIDVIEYDEYLALRFYRDNFIKFDGDTQLHIASLVKEVMEKIRGLGIPIYMEKLGSLDDGRSGLAARV